MLNFSKIGAKIGFSFILILVFLGNISAKTYTWTGATSSDWNNTGNWQVNGQPSIPGSTDDVLFNTGTVNCNINAPVEIKSLTVSGTGTYSGTITQLTGNEIRISGNFDLGTASFLGGTDSIIVGGNLIINNTSTFTSTSGNLVIQGNMDKTSGASFNANNGNVLINDDCVITGGFAFYKLNFRAFSDATVLVVNSIDVNKRMELSGQGILNINNGEIHVKENLINNNTGVGAVGTAAIYFDGSSSQSLTSNVSVQEGALPNLFFNSSSNISLVGVITVVGDWTYDSGVIIPGSSKVVFNSSSTISGNHDLNDMELLASTSDINFTVNSGNEVGVRNLYYEGSNYIRVNTGNLAVYESIHLNNTSLSGGGNGFVKLKEGNASQYIYGTTNPGESALPNLLIDGNTSDLNFDKHITIAGNFIYTSGNVLAGTSMVNMIGDNTSMNAAAVSFYDLVVSGNSITLTNALDVQHRLVINGTLVTGNYNIQLNGDIENNGIFDYGTGSVSFIGSTDQNISGSSATTFYNVALNKPAGKVLLQNNIELWGELFFQKGKIYTAANNVKFLPGSSHSGAGDGNFIDGSVTKSGNSDFVFPLGKNEKYKPFGVSQLTGYGVFVAQYFDVAHPNLADDKESVIRRLCDQEYWELDRDSGTGIAKVSLFYEKNCFVQNEKLLGIATYESSTWKEVSSTNDLTNMVLTSQNAQAQFPLVLTSTLLKGLVINTEKVNATAYQVVDNGIIYSSLNSGEGTDETVILLEELPIIGYENVAEINIAQGSLNQALDVRVYYNYNGDITKINVVESGTEAPLKKNFYDLESTYEVFFKSGDNESIQTDFSSNLNGVELVSWPLEIELDRLDLTSGSSQLIITDPQGVTSTISPIDAAHFSWTGTQSGIHSFELQLDLPGVGIKNFGGQFIKN